MSQGTKPALDIQMINHNNHHLVIEAGEDWQDRENLQMVDEKEMEEKEYYRNRLRQWRDLGFDTHDLEIMLETDFEHFKTMSMEMLRAQLHMMTKEETAPKAKGTVPPSPRVPDRISRPTITEYDDIRKQNEADKEDSLLELRKEMMKRKQLEETGVRDLEEEREYERPSERRVPRKEHFRPREPEEEEDDYPLISFHTPADKVAGKRPSAKDRGPGPRDPVDSEMDQLEEEADLIRRKRRQLEEDEERLRRRKRLLLGDDKARPARELAAEEGTDEEAALIFVDRDREGENGDEPPEEAPEEPPPDDHVRLTIAHKPSEVEEEYEEVVALRTLRPKAPRSVMKGRPVKGPIKRTPPTIKGQRPVKAPIRKAPFPVRRAPVPVRRPLPVKRPKPMVHKEKKRRTNSFVILAVLMVSILVLASTIYYFNVIPNVKANARASNDHVSIGDDVTFYGNGSKGSVSIDTYDWDFGDGTAHGRTKIVHHTFSKAGTFNVTLKIKSDSGPTDSVKIVVHVAHLQVKPPSKMIGDNGGYAVHGWAFIEGPDLYTIHNPYTQFGLPSEIKIQSVSLKYNGTMTSSIRDIMVQEDGYNETHQTLHREVGQNLKFTAIAIPNVGTYPVTIDGTEVMKQQVYVDLKMNQTIKTVTTSSMNTEPIKVSGFTLPKMSSTDDLRTYPDLATVDSQVNVEDLFVDRTLDTGDPSSLQGSIQKGQSPNMVVYSWKYNGTDNVYKRPSIHLNVTIDGNTMAKLGLTALFVDIWVAKDIPTYVKMHTYLEGYNGTNHYKADIVEEMTSFTAGLSAIVGTCGAPHYDPAHPLALFAAFNITPPEGDPAGTSAKFSSHEALLVGMNKSSGFKAYLTGQGSPYAVSGNYSEKSGPTWNLTFGKKGSTEGYNIIVTDIGGGDYNVLAQQVSIDAPQIARDDILSVVSLSSAETIFSSDGKTASEDFVGGKIDFSRTSWLLDANTPYPNLDFTLTSISATQVQYTYTLSKSEPSSGGQRYYTVALNAIDGQLMFAQTHTGSVPIP